MEGEMAGPEGEFSRGFGNGGGVRQVEGRGGEGDDNFAACGILRHVEFHRGWNFTKRLNSAEMDPVRHGVAGKSEVSWGCKFGRESVKFEPVNSAG